MTKPRGEPRQAGWGQLGGLLLAASRSQTRMEPDWEPATISSSGVLRRTLSTGDVWPVRLCGRESCSFRGCTQFAPTHL